MTEPSHKMGKPGISSPSSTTEETALLQPTKHSSKPATRISITLLNSNPDSILAAEIIATRGRIPVALKCPSCSNVVEATQIEKVRNVELAFKLQKRCGALFGGMVIITWIVYGLDYLFTSAPLATEEEWWTFVKTSLLYQTFVIGCGALYLTIYYFSNCSKYRDVVHYCSVCEFRLGRNNGLDDYKKDKCWPRFMQIT